MGAIATDSFRMRENNQRSIVLCMDTLRDLHLDFLNRALSKTKYTPNKLALQAGVTPSTLSKFLAEKTDKLSDRTITKLAQYARIEPPNTFSPHGKDVAPLASSAIALSNTTLDEDEFTLTIQSDALDLLNILPGDLLTFQRTDRPAKGDIVCARLFDRRLGTSESIVRVYDPPFLYARSQNDIHAKPLIVDNENVLVVARLCKQVRVREFPHAEN